MNFLVVSDAPNLKSGLARISRDIASVVQGLGHKVAFLGWDYDDSIQPYPCFSIRDHENWGEADLPRAWWKAFGSQAGVVLTVWDPSRCFHTTNAAQKLPVQLWGYFPIDSHNIKGKISGPALIALRRYQRVLAYGQYGGKVLRASLERPVQWLPHGINFNIFSPKMQTCSRGECEAAGEPAPHSKPEPLPRRLVGAVAANIQRKDFGLLFETWKELASWDDSLCFWLHTDVPVRAWSVPQLAHDFELEEKLMLTTPEVVPDDETLAALYSQCLVTVAPGLGEGFGYPIAESLACGTPVIHVNFAGGAELVPLGDWRAEPLAWRLDSSYALRRPVVDPRSMAARARRAIEWVRREPKVASAYCRGAVEHINWDRLGRFWQQWIQQGVQELREGGVA